jgi:cytidylate kinase
VTSRHPAVIGLSGPIGSGKTTTATLLSEQTGWPYASYGDVVRAVAAGDGTPTGRDQLQLIGVRLIADGWEAFTQRVLDQAAWKPGDGVIVEGIRHAEAAATLKRLTAPLPTIIIYLDLPPETGLARASSRDGTAIAASRQHAAHPIEHDIRAIRTLADLVVPVTGRTPGVITADIIGHLAGSNGRPYGGPHA